MKSLLILLSFSCWIFSSAANAQYTCNDRTYLQEALAKLNRDCGGSSGLCEAKGYKGSTVEKAIEVCVKNHWDPSACLKNVTCENASLCEAKGYKGSTVEKAVEVCVKNHWDPSACLKDATCENASLCEAKGYKGSTVEKAVEVCVKNHWDPSACYKDVTCN